MIMVASFVKIALRGEGSGQCHQLPQGLVFAALARKIVLLATRPRGIANRAPIA